MTTTKNSECPEGAVFILYPGSDTHPDWQSLRARLNECHAASRVVSEYKGIELGCGSFDSGCANALTAILHGLTGINLDASELGNLLGANYPAAAGSPYRQWSRLT